MLNFTTLIQQCHTLFEHTTLCMLNSLREDKTWPCISSPQCYPNCNLPRTASGSLASPCTGTGRARHANSTKAPYKPLGLLNKRASQLFRSQTWSGNESTFRVASEDTVVNSVMLRNGAQRLQVAPPWWPSRGWHLGGHSHQQSQTGKTGLHFQTVRSKKGVLEQMSETLQPTAYVQGQK